MPQAEISVSVSLSAGRPFFDIYSAELTIVRSPGSFYLSDSFANDMSNRSLS